MNKQRHSVAVIGAGGFGRETLDVIRDQDRDIYGVFDDSPRPEDLALLSLQGVPYLGTVNEMLETHSFKDFEYVIGIGTGSVRRVIDERVTPLGFQAATLVHSHASLGFGIELAPGVVICAGARLTTNISLGRHSHVNINATIGHDAILGDYVTLNPVAAISGGVRLGDGVLVGAGAFVIQGKEAGSFSTIGAAAAVMKDVEPGSTVIGVPARPLASRSE